MICYCSFNSPFWKVTDLIEVPSGFKKKNHIEGSDLHVDSAIYFGCVKSSLTTATGNLNSKQQGLEKNIIQSDALRDDVKQRFKGKVMFDCCL